MKKNFPQIFLDFFSSNFKMQLKKLKFKTNLKIFTL